MSEGNSIIKYWKISPGEGAEYWDEFKENSWISIGWYNDKDWRKTEFGDLTLNPDKENIIKILREEEPVLFCWSSVTGNDKHRLLSFLKKSQFEQYWDETKYEDLSAKAITKIFGDIKVPKDILNEKIADEFFDTVKDMDIGRDDSAKIKKTNEDKTIRVFYGENVAEITLDEDDKKTATLIFNKNGHPIKLYAKNENGKLNIYRHTDRELSSWADSIKRFFEIKPGHKVMVYGKNFHINALAEVIGEYEFNKKFDFPHIKRVEWQAIFEKPLDIKPILNDLEKQAFRQTIVPITQKDWFAISNHAKPAKKRDEFVKKTTNIDMTINDFQKNLNVILYGPPGTGKTYETVNKALEIIHPDSSLDKERHELMQEFNKFLDKKQITFITFHQSYSYEDFVEGLKPEADKIDPYKITYRIVNGVFKEIPPIDGIALSELLESLNNRITALIDLDHQIGHSYFLSLKGLELEEAKKNLIFIWYKKIIPLLQEYFYNDWERLSLVLGGGFIQKINNPFQGNDSCDYIYKIKPYNYDNWDDFKSSIDTVMSEAQILTEENQEE